MITIKLATKTISIAPLNIANYKRKDNSILKLITFPDGQGFTTCLYDDLTKTISLSSFSFYFDNASLVFSKTKQQLDKIYSSIK